MAQRRMFSKTIIDSDEFLEMPVSSRLLYFDLGMRADDDGFVSPKRIMRITNSTDDDLKVLLTKKYVLNFENKVLVIRDWKVNNFIRPDRYTPTIYQEYLKILQITDSNQYQIKRLISGIPDDIPKVGIGKVRLGKSKDRIDSDKQVVASSIFSLEDETKKLEDSPRRDLNVIAFYIEQRKPNIETNGQLQVFIHRHLRAAKEVKEFSDSQIITAAKKCSIDYKNIDWTIETIKKVLTK